MTETVELPRSPEQRVRRSADSHAQGASPTLPPELLADGARRLGWLALVYAGGITVGYFGRRLLLMFSGDAAFQFRVSDGVTLVVIAMAIAVSLIVRSGRLSPQRLLDLGLVFQVAGAFGLAVTPLFDGQSRAADIAFGYIPTECVWIVAYPLVVPNTPGKVLVASLLAASTGPAAALLASAATGIPIDRPGLVAVNYLTSNYVCAIVAYVIGRMVHRFNMRLKHLHEVGSYELVECIGEGGMGEVWRAKHRLLARPAAIKLIRADVLGASQRSRDAIVRRFEREAKDTAMLGSTHTIDIYDFGVTEEGDFYYVMELLEGFSLERYVQLYGPMEPARVVSVLQQVCHSLGEAHTRGLVHRDVKPANIFLCRLGPDDDFVKVLDFGLVKHFEAPAGTMLTMEGVTAGTPAYMAPEVALGQYVDGRADLYALGCVAYYLLTGQPVFSADSDVATALAHVKDVPVPPSVRSEFNIPPALESLILDSLAKDPGARPSSAEVFSDRLGATVPTLWTSRDAHAWCELHRIDLVRNLEDSAAPAAAGEAADAPAKGRRCWPRFDRKPLTKAPLAQ